MRRTNRIVMAVAIILGVLLIAEPLLGPAGGQGLLITNNGCRVDLSWPDTARQGCRNYGGDD